VARSGRKLPRHRFAGCLGGSRLFASVDSPPARIFLTQLIPIKAARRQPSTISAIDNVYPKEELAVITLADAKKIIAAAERKAAEIGQPQNIAVVDGGGNLVAHQRMDGAWLGSIDISINKAFTARAFDLSTKDLGKNAQPGQQFFGIHVSNHGRIMIFAGGIPLRRNGEVVGAIGVSGGSGEQDQAVAEAGAAAFS
jgi:uncharacterized protein GlcG (DUF336 family)